MSLPDGDRQWAEALRHSQKMHIGCDQNRVLLKAGVITFTSLSCIMIMLNAIVHCVQLSQGDFWSKVSLLVIILSNIEIPPSLRDFCFPLQLRLACNHQHVSTLTTPMNLSLRT
jgi:hypothetical protein